MTGADPAQEVFRILRANAPEAITALLAGDSLTALIELVKGLASDGIDVDVISDPEVERALAAINQAMNAGPAAPPVDMDDMEGLAGALLRATQNATTRTVMATVARLFTAVYAAVEPDAASSTDVHRRTPADRAADARGLPSGPG